tara:strand:- start:93 stop:254 length:162 start_codon:yes stop_codon:yes gene_type:complete
MSLVENIRKRQRAGRSRSKSNSTISDKNYAEMKRGWKNTKNAQKQDKAKRKMA